MPFHDASTVSDVSKFRLQNRNDKLQLNIHIYAMITKALLKTIFMIAAKIISLAIFLMTILSAYGGRVNPEFTGIPATLALALPYLGGATIIITILWIIGRKIIFPVLGGLTLLACMPTLSQAFPFGSPKKAAPGETTFTLMTYNIIHTEDQQYPDISYNRSLQYVINSGADIVCLQELLSYAPDEIRHYSEPLIDSLRQAYPYRAGTYYDSDLKVFSKYPVRLVKKESADSEFKLRYDFFEVDIKGHRLNIANCHLISYSLTTDDREILTDIRNVQSAKHSLKEFKTTVRQKLSSAFRLRAHNAASLREEIDGIKGDLIVCGDFNDVPGSWAYRKILGDDLHDAYAETNFGPTFTYNSHLFYFHIDQILYKGNLRALSVKRGDIKASDHYPLFATFAFTK